MKKLLMLLTICLALLCLCLPALAEVEIEIVDANYIRLPQEGGMKMRFRNTDKWTFVTNDNLDEHIDRVLSRGGTEEAIRERYARDTFLFEAYSEQLPGDVCIRVELFEDDLTRYAWHARHLDLERRTYFFDSLADGMYIPWYDVYQGVAGRNHENADGSAYFTSTPHVGFESGIMILRLINGRMYVVTFNVYGRFAGLPNLLTKEDEAARELTPIYSDITFTEKALPQLPAFDLDGEWPMQADVGDLTLSGSIRAGGSLVVTLDEENIPVKLNRDSGKFTVVLPLTEEGDREVVFTVTHPKNTERVERYAINVSSIRTKLQFTELPQDRVQSGDVKVAGESDPGASISLTLDEGEPILITADEEGKFAHTFTLKDHAQHHLFIMATAPDYKDTFKMETWFITEFEAALDGVTAFRSKMKDIGIEDIAANPEEYQDERVRVETYILKVDILDDGLGLYCKKYVQKKYYGQEEPEPVYFYVKVYGYAHCEPRQHMALDVYGVVNGTCEYDGAILPVIDMHYGVYTVYK